MAERINSEGKIQVGDFFESCSFHPCLCIEVDEGGVNIEGISFRRTCTNLQCYTLRYS